MRMRVDVRGMKELHQSLEALPLKVQRSVLGGALLKAAEPMRETAEQRAPVGTKRPKPAENILSLNIVTRQDKAKRGSKGAAVRVGFNKSAAHGVLQELGTKHHAAQPFLRPAFDEKKAEAVRIARREIGAAIVKRGTP